MRIALAMALFAMCSFVFATNETDSASTQSQQSTTDVYAQWGIEALNFPKQIHMHSAESLGLTLPSPRVFLPNTVEFHGLNASYSYGKFTAETGLLTQSHDLSDTSHFYLQGAYSLFENERFNVALTAKVEALNNDAINNYYGNSDNIHAYTSVFQQAATNTTIGLMSTYAINKQWKIQGLISSTSLDNKIENSPLVASDSIHMALIKTSYAF